MIMFVMLLTFIHQRRGCQRAGKIGAEDCEQEEFTLAVNGGRKPAGLALE
jgi:hypothetical protein